MLKLKKPPEKGGFLLLAVVGDQKLISAALALLSTTFGLR